MNIKKNRSSQSGSSNYLVGIGASAGGLEALEYFFESCPSDSGLAFVVIQHLSPDHKSMMSDLLSRYTEMPIHIVEEGMVIEPNHVYLIPAGALIRVDQNGFLLSKKMPHVLTLPIDIFFSSLAENFKDKAIGVILSGTGSDGSRGSYAINESGGFLLAQEPKEAKFDGMPKSIISTGLVDEVLPANKIAKRILEHTKNPQQRATKSKLISNDQTRPVDEESALDMIFDYLLQIGGVDFRDYKLATVNRRIERRMQVKRIPSLEDYALLLRNDSQELANLRRELFIPVTSFFRDPKAFESLDETVIQKIVEEVPEGETIRVWSAGVASAEEVYSIVILFMEAFEKFKRWPSLKVFATDANPQILESASSGTYPESIAAEVTQARLEKYFVKTGSNYVVKPELRQSVVFARHNLLVDPPFTRMELVTCRNTLIYFKPEAQVKAVHRLQYATKPGGYLFLGTSESLTGMTKGFTVVSNKYKLFQRTHGNLPFNLDANSQNFFMPPALKRTNNIAHKKVLNDVSLIDESQAQLLKAYAPAAILVNERHEMIHLFGNLQPYFKVRDGSASLDINRILPEVLISVVSALLYKALKDQIVLYSDIVKFKGSDNQLREVRVSVRPLDLELDERHALITFEEQNLIMSNEYKVMDIDQETENRIELMQQELAATRESLQATIEELETSNEELQATNEELMASNEELQSSNEELQSVNEEMNTVNAEFQEKVLRLNQTNADLDTMAKAVGVATIFVDAELQITRYTPDASLIFKVRESDIGRPLSDIRHTIHDENLITYFESTLELGRLFEKEVECEDERTYLLRILPYYVTSSSKPGAVATLTDVTVLQDKLRLQSILDALPEHVAVLSSDGVITMINEAWKRFAKANGDPRLEHSGIGVNYLDVCYPIDNGKNSPDESIQKAYFGVKGVLERQIPYFSMKYPCHSPTENRWFVMNVAPIMGNVEQGVVVSHNNITAWLEEDQK